MFQEARRIGGPLRVIASLLLASAPAAAGTPSAVTLQPIQDNTVYEEGALSNGAGAHLFSGNTAFDSARRAFLAFDVAGAIPAGSTITGGLLDLSCTVSPAINPASQTFTLHRLTADWGEAGSDAGEPGGVGAGAATGDVTWTERFFGQGQPWATPGGDFVAAPSGAANVATCSATAPTLVTFDPTPEITADIQAWLDDPSSNFGWILVGDETTLATARRFSSREHDERDLRPRLVVSFELTDVPASSPASAVLLVALVGLAAAFVLLRRLG